MTDTSEGMRKRRLARTVLLRSIYDTAEGSVTEFVAAYELAADQGVDPAEAPRILSYLEEKGYLLVDDHRAGIVRITATGVDAVELGVLD